MTPAEEWPAAGPVRWGLVIVALLVVGFGLWAALTPIAGAVIASGRIDVSQSRQVLQHPEGGRIAAILVAEGDRVAAGQILLRLDGQALRSDLVVTETQLVEATIERARLEAEGDGRAEIRLPADLEGLVVAHPDLATLKQAALRHLAARTAETAAERDQLALRRTQIADQIKGLQAQAAATERQIALLERDLATQHSLLDQGLAQASRVLSAERELAQLDGALAGLEAAEAEAESRSSEAALEALRVDAARRDRLLADLRVASAQAAELTERRSALKARITGLDLRAPAAGIVLGLATTSAGAVLRPAEPALYIVPQDRPYVIVARVDPGDIDQIHPGQPARLRLSAFDSRRTPDLTGRVEAVSADALADQAQGRSFYRVEVALSAGEVDRLGPAPLLPGMPVEVFVTTRDRTPLAYLTAPLRDYFRRAFRDG
jgi:HlyD family secretion protein